MMCLAQEPLTNVWHKGGSRNFAMVTRAEDGRGRPTAVDKEHLKALIEPDPRKTTREVAVEIEVDHSTVVRHLQEIGKTKKLISKSILYIILKRAFRSIELCYLLPF